MIFYLIQNETLVIKNITELNEYGIFENFETVYSLDALLGTLR